MEGTRDACSKGLLEKFGKLVQREKHRLAQIGRGSKAWRSISSRLLQHRGAVCSVSAFQDNNDGWVQDAARKANLFAETFSEKCQLCTVEHNAYSDIYASPYREQK